MRGRKTTVTPGCRCSSVGIERRDTHALLSLSRGTTRIGCSQGWLRLREPLPRHSSNCRASSNRKDSCNATQREPVQSSEARRNPGRQSSSAGALRRLMSSCTADPDDFLFLQGSPQARRFHHDAPLYVVGDARRACDSLRALGCVSRYHRDCTPSDALGTDLSDMFPELTMVARSNTGTEDVVVANTLEGQGLGRYWDPLSYYHGCLPPTSPTSCNGSTWKVLDLSFASPTNFVEIENTWLSDYGMFLVLDQDNNILANSQTVASAPSGGKDVRSPDTPNFPPLRTIRERWRSSASKPALCACCSVGGRLPHTSKRFATAFPQPQPSPSLDWVSWWPVWPGGALAGEDRFHAPLVEPLRRRRGDLDPPNHSVVEGDAACSIRHTFVTSTNLVPIRSGSRIRCQGPEDAAHIRADWSCRSTYSGSGR